MAEYIVERLFPVNRIHLLAGISSAGKTRWAIPMGVMWSACLPVLGLKSHPQKPWCVVASDRPLADVQDTVRSMGLPLSEVPILPAFGKHSRALYQTLGMIAETKVKFVLWEGFDMLVKNPNNPYEVREMLSDVSAHCESADGLTVLGTVGVAKLKPGEAYMNPRQLVSGTTIWERATSTNLIIVPENPGDIADPRRIMYCSLKNSPSFTVNGSFDENGILSFCDWNALSEEALTEVLKEIRNAHKKRNR